MSDKISITVHRGSHQIGGCCTEIAYKGTRIAIDFGSPLPGEDESKLDVHGITSGKSVFYAVLFTHYHGDHIGEMGRINHDIPIYMSGFAKDIIAAYKDYSDRFYPEINPDKIIELIAGKEIIIGSLKILPIRSDHSAAESFMFLISADDFHILHTGDFRLHGKYRDELISSIRSLGKIDLLITEGTSLSRKEDDKDNYTEELVEEEIRKCIYEKPYCFFILSSTNFDRFKSIYVGVDKYCAEHAPKGKYIIVDDFQKGLLELAEKHSPDRYRFKKKTTYARNLDNKMEKTGFAMILRTSNREHEKLLKEYLAKHSEETCLIYSMWSGYLESGKLKELTDLAHGERAFRIIHSSGHVTMQDLKEFVNMIDPKKIIVIHTETQDIFGGIDRQIPVEDGKTMEFIKQ